jgi:hydroxymethylpyrimidine/phosphomethylpyrimidine kinase
MDLEELDFSRPELVKALTIAASDSGGGAGLQADLKTFAALGVFGLTCVTAVTAQNSYQVTAMECLSGSIVGEQLRAVKGDLGFGAIKIGLLGNAENARVVGEFLGELKGEVPVILDPVMVSTSGYVFLPKDAIDALTELFPLAALITPNVFEAEYLTGVKIKGPEDLERAGEVFFSRGLANVLIKGGHLEGRLASDLLIGPDGVHWFKIEKVETDNNHGTGCTLSSAIAALMAKGVGLMDSIKIAKRFLYEALGDSVKLGRGPGVPNHFYGAYSYRKGPA